MGCGGTKDDKTKNPKVIPSPASHLNTSETPSKSKDNNKFPTQDYSIQQNKQIVNTTPSTPSTVTSAITPAKSSPVVPQASANPPQPEPKPQPVKPQAIPTFTQPPQLNSFDPMFVPNPVNVLPNAESKASKKISFADSWSIPAGISVDLDTISSSQNYTNILYKHTITTGVSTFEFEVLGSNLDSLLIGAFRSDLNPSSIRLDSKSSMEIFSYEGRGFTHTEFGEFTYNQRAWKFNSNDRIKLEIDMDYHEIRYYKNNKKIHTHDGISSTLKVFLGISQSSIKLIQDPYNSI